MNSHEWVTTYLSTTAHNTRQFCQNDIKIMMVQTFDQLQIVIIDSDLKKLNCLTIRPVSKYRGRVEALLDRPRRSLILDRALF